MARTPLAAFFNSPINEILEFLDFIFRPAFSMIRRVFAMGSPFDLLFLTKGKIFYLVPFLHFGDIGFMGERIRGGRCQQ
jgi:hypothetical protein